MSKNAKPETKRSKFESKFIAALKRLGWNFNCRGDEDDVLALVANNSARQCSAALSKLWAVPMSHVSTADIELARTVARGKHMTLSAKEVLRLRVVENKFKEIIRVAKKINTIKDS